VLCLGGAAGAGARTKRSPARHAPAPAAPKPPPGPPPVYVFPVPGAHFASSATQISFRGIPAGELGAITVTGAVSGAHAGSVQADSDGSGGSFIPAAPFAPGEIVTVATSLNLEGSHDGAYQFQVASPAGPLPFEHRPAAPREQGDVWYFRSRPDLAPAAVRLTKRDPANHSDIFLAPQVGPLQQGPEIVGPGGGLIWFNPLPKDYAATDFRVQAYQGQPVLTWWQGNETSGVGSGQDIIMNSSYQVVKTVSAGNGLSADLHEFQLTPRGTALITAEYPVYANGTAVEGVASEVVLDSVVQEIDIPTGLVLFEWDSLDHVPLTDGYTRPPNAPKKKGKKPLPNFAWDPYDYFHANSVGLDRDGNVVVSARNTWAVYKLNYHTGTVMWTLGGKRSSFKLARGVAFAFQHDVRVRAPGDGLLTMFDDGAGPPYVHSQSRVLKVHLDLKRRTATVVAQRVHSPPLLASFEGDDQQLPGQDDFVGWGQEPYFSEFNSRGKLVFDGRFVGSNLTYRAYRFAWNGRPATPPAFAVSRHGRKMTVYASWNGATGISAWRVFGGSRASALPALATTLKRGFETAIVAPARAYVAVEALDAKGRPLVRSGVQAVP
jgi:Arylsulfotransferase (ASST)